ncbi:hla-b associated transcript 1 [Vairimorpha apis BRL 01]|uniref:RNA helicase n=1 Tax=Vairimorpha apis BRL 01 TaxID=1037528 RepID=T0L619_9MICR|nr:hla-b associated transcript 1 [Vairimorpha apis BRL 01]
MSDDELIEYKEDSINIRKTNKQVSSAQFKDFLLRDELMDAIKDAAFEHPSEVQQMAIPKAILGQDILCQAKSGTGKTAVFVLSTLNQLKVVDKETVILTIVHTKEMADQVKQEFERFSKKMENISVGVVYGGNSVEDDMKVLSSNSPTILIGTPGRLYEVVRRKALNLKHVKYFIMDECDRMVGDLDMRNDVQEIFVSSPRNKQTLMFTATLNSYTFDECMRFLDNPFVVRVDEESKLTLYGLKQYYVELDEKDKLQKLHYALNSNTYNQAMIFTSNKKSPTTLVNFLKTKNFQAIELHAGLSSEERKNRLIAFKKYEHRVLITTDLLSRGIDVQDVNMVINYDMPDTPETYLHRVGRAGRFETEGIAISFVCNQEEKIKLNEVQSRFEISINKL